MTTGQKIYECRKNAGLTQEELAEKLGVSRQAVSKWESDAAFPETEKILELCKMFSISADELLFGTTRVSDQEDFKEKATETKEETKEETNGIFICRVGNMHYEYISKTELFGLPLVHINFGLGMYRAKGIFAFGNVATGLCSFGLLSLGILSFGLLSLGLLAFGSVAVGLLFGAGAVGIGAIAFGGVAIGIMSFGGLSIGYIAVGGASVGQYAMGDWASGFIAVGRSNAIGEHAFRMPEMLLELGDYCNENIGGWLGSFIQSVAHTLS